MSFSCKNTIAESIENNVLTNTLQPFWTSTRHGSGDDVFWSIAVDNLNVYAAGWTNSSGMQSYDVLLCKYDMSGNELWNRTWGGNAWDRAFSIAVDSSSIYVVGETLSYGSGLADVFVLKYDLNGNLLWETTWGGNENDTACSIAIDSSSIYVVGDTASFGSGYADMFILKYDLNGVLQWTKTWGGSDSEGAFSVVTDSSYLFITGWKYSFTTNNYSSFVLKTDLNGDELWNKTWNGGDDNFACSIAVDGMNIYIAGGIGYWNVDVFIVKYDLNGNEIWNRTWGGNLDEYDSASSIIIHDANIYVAGSTCNDPVWLTSDVLVLKYDSNGNLIWNKTWGGGLNDYGCSITVDNYSCLYVAGIIGLNTDFGAFVLKTDLDGNNTIPNQSPIAVIDSITPNPASSGQTVTFKGHGYDFDGMIVAYRWFSSTGGGLLSNQASFNMSSLSVGTHSIELWVIDNNNSLSQVVTVTLIVKSNSGNGGGGDGGTSDDKSGAKDSSIMWVLVGITTVTIIVVIGIAWIYPTNKRRKGPQQQLTQPYPTQWQQQYQPPQSRG